MKLYYGVEYFGGHKSCSMGSPNKRTGRMSMAASFVAFRTKDELTKWIDKGYHRERIAKHKIRSLCLGESVHHFNFWFNELLWYTDIKYEFIM